MVILIYYYSVSRYCLFICSYTYSTILLILFFCFTECCKRFLLLRWCGNPEGDEEDQYHLTSGKGGKYEYEICRNTEEDLTEITRGGENSINNFDPSNNRYRNNGDHGGDNKSGGGSDTDVDFTLRNVEDVIGGDSRDDSRAADPIETRWQDTSLTVISALGNRRYE